MSISVDDTNGTSKTTSETKGTESRSLFDPDLFCGTTLRTKSTLPGLHPLRLHRLMAHSIRRCQLTLDRLTVLTEAATGAYVVTPVLAAMAGARAVYAVTKDSRFGSADEAATQTYELARIAGVERQIHVLKDVNSNIIATADIVTNSGHVRPIDATKISAMKPTAVIPLMYENWEFRSSDVDVETCRRYGILVAGTNERHPQIDVFKFLGNMAVKLLLDSGIALVGSHILLVCNNAFRSYLETGLLGAGANIMTGFQEADRRSHFDAVLVATTPAENAALSTEDLKQVAEISPGSPIIQFFGTLDRNLIQQHGIPIWPVQEPERGHMGILPSAIGPEPIVRLQTGGLKVGEVLNKRRNGSLDTTLDFAQPFPL